MKIELSGHYTVLRILRTIFPSVGMMVIMNAYSIVDGYFVSNWAGNKDELHSLLVKSLAILGGFGIILTVMAETFALPITRIFVGYDKDIVELTVHATRIYMLSFLICGINMFTSAWFTALNNGGVSAVAAFTRTLVFELSAVFILPAIFGVDGIWMSVNVAEVLALILSALLIVSCRKRYGY